MEALIKAGSKEVMSCSKHITKFNDDDLKQLNRSYKGLKFRNVSFQILV